VEVAHIVAMHLLADRGPAGCTFLLNAKRLHYAKWLLLFMSSVHFIHKHILSSSEMGKVALFIAIAEVCVYLNERL
jgi:hypothetical protein